MHQLTEGQRDGVTHRAGVLGSPIAHSLSPLLHTAAYRELGLVDWAYDAADVVADALADHVAGLDGSWRGLSLTMPLKEAAFEVATSVSDLARQTGAINTLVRSDAGWAGDNTDVHGLVAALREVGLEEARSALVIGSGATARSAVAAVAGLGARSVTFMVRGEVRPDTLAQARAAGLETARSAWGHWPVGVDVTISTVPSAALAGTVAALPEALQPAVLLDVVYADGPTALLEAAKALGYAVSDGTRMLLHQAGEQVRLMTGAEPPLAAMAAALDLELTRRAWA